MIKEITDIDAILQPILTRRRRLILEQTGISPELLDADLYRNLRDMKNELKKKEQSIVLKDAVIHEKEREIADMGKVINGKDKTIADKDRVITDKDKTIADKDKIIAEKDAEIIKLKQQLGKLDRPVTTSMNSSLPPSKNPIGIKHTNSIREKSGKTTGGHKGHKGITRMRSLTPGIIELCAPEYCPCCGEKVDKDQLYEKEIRQQIDLPSPVIPIITDYVQLTGTCKCGTKLKGEFPAGIEGNVSYGPNVQAAVAFLSTEQSISFKRIPEIMKYLFGIEMSQGTIGNILKKMRKNARIGCEAIRKRIESSDIIGADETGINIDGKTMWMWVFQTELLTYMFVDDGRRKAIIDKHFPDGFRDSILVTDRLASYFNVDVMEHQDCLVHILRNTFFFALLLSEESWPLDFMDFLRESIDTKKKEGASIELFNKQKEKLDELLGRTPKAENEEDAEKYDKLNRFIQQMIKHRDNLLTFLKYESVPADNNASEREIRTVKTKMKVSGMFKTLDGAQAYADIHSIVRTAKKNGRNPFIALVEVAKYKPSKEEQ